MKKASKSGWRVIGSNDPIPMSERDYKKYRDKMFKWGLFVDKMKVSKPRFNKKPKEKKEEVE